MSPEAAESMARHALASLGRRLAHVAAVAQASGRVANCLQIDGDPLVSAAWLHDIGYSPDASITGFHALDGARLLRQRDVPEPVVNLVAHHSHAVFEAEIRGLRAELETEFPCDPALPHDLLCYCDMTTGPSGERVPVERRLREIRERYGPNDVVTQFIESAENEIVATVERIEKNLAGAAQSK